MSDAPGTGRLVVFDCDGVLVDSERLAVNIDVLAVRSLGWDITAEEVVELFVGKSEHDMRAVLEARTGRPNSPEWDAAWQAEYRRVLDERLEPVPGAPEAVRAVVEAGFDTCVASSGSHEKMSRTLAKTGLWDVFAGRIFSATEVDAGKPAPDLFLHAASRMGFAPEHCIVVEDSRYGVQGARAAGMRVIGYAGGVTPRAALTHADAVIDDMALLLDTVTDLAG